MRRLAAGWRRRPGRCASRTPCSVRAGPTTAGERPSPIFHAKDSRGSLVVVHRETHLLAGPRPHETVSGANGPRGDAAAARFTAGTIASISSRPNRPPSPAAGSGPAPRRGRRRAARRAKHADAGSRHAFGGDGSMASRRPLWMLTHGRSRHWPHHRTASGRCDAGVGRRFGLQTRCGGVSKQRGSASCHGADDGRSARSRRQPTARRGSEASGARVMGPKGGGCRRRPACSTGAARRHVAAPPRFDGAPACG